MTVMVVDVGGGTTDITVHACRSVGGQVVLAEAVSAEGSLCGAVMVDEAFRCVAEQAGLDPL
jgi:molecular chaperone DnaK (HSP70)